MIPRGTVCPFPAPADVDQANETWGANCGPCSIAALLGMSLEHLRPHLGRFEQRRYMNPTQVRGVLEQLGLRYQIVGTTGQWPTDGLVFVQWRGPWDKAPVHVQYQHTHWIAVRGAWIYEVNNREWCPRDFWREQVAPEIASRHEGSDGRWSVRTAYEVELPKPPT